MEKIVIKCHRAGNSYTQPHFFVLNKGVNSGKPLREPCPNCFVVFTDTVNTNDYLYWLSWGMWQGKAFHPYLIGSVIEFIRIGDYKRLLLNTLERTQVNTKQVYATIEKLKKLSNTEILVRKQLALLNQAKKSIYHHKIAMLV